MVTRAAVFIGRFNQNPKSLSIFFATRFDRVFLVPQFDSYFPLKKNYLLLEYWKFHWEKKVI